MTESEIMKIINDTVRSVLAQTLLGASTKTDDAYTGSIQRFATDSEINGLRLIRPYGFVSRPPKGTTTVVHPVNGDASHLLSLGDFDIANRPAIGDSESGFYGSNGQVVYTSGTDLIIGDYLPHAGGTFKPFQRAVFHQDGSYQLGFTKSISSNSSGHHFIGSITASSPLVLGDVLQSFCDQLLTILTTVLNAIESGPIAITTTPGAPAPTAPNIVTAMTQAITDIATLKTNLVDSTATNFNSLANFTERGT